MLLRGEMTLIGAHEADDQEDRADQNVKAVEARRHIEGRAVVALHEAEGRMGIFIGRDRREDGAEDDRQPQAFLKPLEVAVDRSEEHTSERQSLMRISYAVLCLKKKNMDTKPHK